MTPAPILLAGRWIDGPTPVEIHAPYDGSLVGRTSAGGLAEIEAATAAAAAAAPAMAAVPGYERAAILRRVSDALTAGRDGFADTLAREAGKPLKDARIEVERAALTFAVAAGEATRIAGETLPLDLAPHGVGRFAITRRFPIGPVAGI